MKKKKRKKRKFDIRDGETHIESLRRRSREQGFTTGNDEFPIKNVFWILIIAGLILGLYFSKPVSVNECAKGFSGLKPCHCYTEDQILNDPNVPANCL